MNDYDAQRPRSSRSSQRDGDRPRPVRRSRNESGYRATRGVPDGTTQPAEETSTPRTTSRRTATGGRSTASRRTRPVRQPESGEGRGALVRRLLLLAAILSVFLVVAGCVGYAGVSRGLPDPTKQIRGTDQTTRILDRNGALVAKLFAEQNRTRVALDDIPLALRYAVISTEDERFYRHKGVDPIGVARAVWVDIRERDDKQGGSTITQQTVRNAFITPERTAKRKAQEAILAYRLEKRYSKDEILEMYLNTIYFGHGAYGVEAAAQTYYGKHVGDLSVSECAMIAGVIKSPARYSPYLDPDAARGRRATVLGQMLRQGFVSKRAHATAVKAPFALAGLDRKAATAPYYMEYVKALLTERFGAEAVYRGGLTVRTTLDLKLQRAAEKAVAATLDRDDDPSAALVALDPKTGAIVAMVGGRSFEQQQFNVAVQGRRQPGSAFKPFVLATALAAGVSPEKTYDAGAARLDVPGQKAWSVTGAENGKRGPMRLREATAQSVNSVFARLILDLGPEKVAATAAKLGITTELTPVPAIALGGLKEGVTPLEMASAYATLDNGGVRIPPTAVLQVDDARGKVLFKAAPKGTRAVGADVAYLTTDILEGVVDHGTGKAADIGRPQAGKTGTTQEYRDAWYVGYTPQLVCSVWVGHVDSQKEMLDVHGRKVTGGSFPAKIWAAFMREAAKDTPKTDFVEPKGLTKLKICLGSGMKAGPFCLKTGTGLFITGHTPKSCSVHKVPTEIKIPDLLGMTKEDALALLKKLMLRWKIVEAPSKTVAVGTVTGQTPAAGSTGTTQTVVTVVVSKGKAASAPPVASFLVQPDKPKSHTPTVFDASASTDDVRIASWVWEFGDGSQGTGKVVEHPFTAPGSYEVTLWVTDSDGQVSSTTRTVLVK